MSDINLYEWDIPHDNQMEYKMEKGGQNEEETTEYTKLFKEFRQSMEWPFKLRKNPKIPKSMMSTDGNQSDFSPLFKVLEELAIKFLKQELQKLERHLSQHQTERGDDMDTSDQDHKSSAKEGVLKIALYILRTMNKTDVAEKLAESKLLMDYQCELMYNIRKKFKCIFEGKGNTEQDSKAPLHKIYTEVYITKGRAGGVNFEHEVRQIETMSKISVTPEVTIKYNDILKVLPGQGTQRIVLTTGIAGIGKTVCVQKFILDWAEGRANQDIHFIFPLPFRDLNLMWDKECSLLELLNNFLPQVKCIGSFDLNYYRALFIFDGLDECRLPLNFHKNTYCCSPTETTSVDGVLTNLIKGNLLPRALIWITSRPAATSRIPPEHVHEVNELQGFNDLQKEEYFKKRFSDQNLAQRVITHVKSLRTLNIMCHIPVFCWILATVFEKADKMDIPKSLTEIYTHFLIFQISAKNKKVLQKQKKGPHKLVACQKEFIMNLGKLALHNLEVGNLIFYKKDVIQCGLDTTEASMESGLFTEIFHEEVGMYQEKVYCFLHLSIQEYLAALYVFLKHGRRKNLLHAENSISSLLKNSVDQALLSKNGHLDLFLRFLLGLSHESNQTLLQGLLKQTKISTYKTEEITRYIKEKIRENLSPERTINLFYCLNELNDCFLTEEVHSYLHSDGLSRVRLTPSQLSALAFVLLVSKEELDVFDLKKYTESNDGLLRLLPVVKASRTALLNKSKLTHNCCRALAAAISTSSSILRALDLSENNLMNVGVKCLSAGLGNPQCTLETLRMSHCGVTEAGCASLALALSSNPSHLRELDLSNNHIGDSGLRLLSAGLQDLKCKLEKLRLKGCDLTTECCEILASAVSSYGSQLREVDLSNNSLSDSGATLLSAGLWKPECKLEVLRLSGCQITDEGCNAVASTLRSNPSHLRELDLGYNQIRDSGVIALSAGLEDPNCKLEKLRLSGCSMREKGCTSLASALRSAPSNLKHLELNYSQTGNTGVILLSVAPEDPYCVLETLRLRKCNLTKDCCELLASAICSNSSHLKELDLSDNDLQDSGVNLLSVGLGNAQCKLETLGLSGCQVTEDGCGFLKSALCSNPSHLKELDLSYNHPGDSGVKLLSTVLQDPNFQLKTLSLDHGGKHRIKPGLEKYAHRLTLDPDTAYQYLLLSQGDRQATHVEHRQPYPDHPGRYTHWPQVLCREGLTGRCYWEVEWSGEEVHLAVAYRNISREGWGEDSCLGQNARSWNLECFRSGYRASHNENDIEIAAPPFPSHRIGVYLDWPAGTLSFYSLCPSKRILLHTFHTMFSKPLHPGFTVCLGSSVSLCLLP